jgi:hypothetical protein
VIRVKAVVAAAVGVTIGLVFLPRWLGIPVAVVTGALGLGTAVLGGTVALDRAAGLLVLRMGLITRRVRFTDITAVLVDQAKVSVARVKGGEISVYAWRRGPLDALLGVPVVASDIGHAIASCVALAGADGGAAPATEGAAREERPAGADRVLDPADRTSAAGQPPYVGPAAELLQVDLAAGDSDGLSGQGGGGRARDNRPVADLELAAVAGAVDRAAGDLVAQAPDMSADRAEGLVLALGRLGDHHFRVRVDHAAAHRDVAGRAEQRAAWHTAGLGAGAA